MAGIPRILGALRDFDALRDFGALRDLGALRDFGTRYPGLLGGGAPSGLVPRGVVPRGVVSREAMPRGPMPDGAMPVALDGGRGGGDRVAAALHDASALRFARDFAALSNARDAFPHAAPRLPAFPATPADIGGPIVHGFAGSGTPLVTTPQAERAIALGLHQIPVVAGVPLAYPSQNLGMIESADPGAPGQTHVIARHVGSDLEANVARLRRDPHIRAAGGYTDLAAAQAATDATIANPANQRFIADFLADGTRSKDALLRVDLGRSVGASTLRVDLDAGHPRLLAATSATIVIVKDPSFPEGYRVLTSYPEATRGAQVDAAGNER